MNFPTITHIDDVLRVVKDNPNISVYTKDEYVVVDYILNTPDLFNHPIEKECRGIIFSALTGKLLRRPLHKFFNLNERPESSSDNLNMDKHHAVLEKLDGCLHSQTMIEFCDGSRHKISEIVTKKAGSLKRSQRTAIHRRTSIR